VPIEVQRHARGLVPEHLLDDFDVGSGGDRQRGCSVPQTVRRQVRLTDAGRGWREGAPAKVPVAQNAAPPATPWASFPPASSRRECAAWRVRS
jgi:hypothetical protein